MVMGARIKNCVHYQFISVVVFDSLSMIDFIYCFVPSILIIIIIIKMKKPSCFLVSSLLLLSLSWLRLLLAFTLADQLLFSCSVCLQGLPFQTSHKCSYINFSKAELWLCLFSTSTLSCPLTWWEYCVYPQFPPKLSSPSVPGDTLLSRQEAC